VQHSPDDKRIRSFVALDVTPPVRAALQTLVAELAATKADVRWVPPAGMHLTLKFLGAVEAAHLDRVHAALAAAVHEQAALQLRVRGLGAFPSLRRPRVLWVGLRGAGLVELARLVEQTLEPLGFAPEPRPFAPHITLGRVGSLRGWERLEEVYKGHLDDDFGDSPVDLVTIYRSTLHPEGAIYSSLWTIPLRRHKEGATYDTGR